MAAASNAPGRDGATAEKPEQIHIRVSNPTLVLVPICAASFGFISGLLSASQKSSLQFLAENAHRQPTTMQGWYFYNKTKNYRVALAGFRGGLQTAFRLGSWTTGFVVIQDLASRGLGGKRVDAQGGALSGIVMALAASTIYRLPTKTLGKRCLLGLTAGAVAGGLQDLQRYVAEKGDAAVSS